MGRYIDADSDAERLPEGMKRIGYDADTQVYTYRDADGSIWEGAPGAEFGRLHRQGANTLISEEQALAEEAAVSGENRRSWRMLAPFLLIVCLVPLFVFRMLGGWSSGSGSAVAPCSVGSEAVVVRSGDTCWDIAQKYGVGLDDLKGPGEDFELDCKALNVGDRICVKSRNQNERV